MEHRVDPYEELANAIIVQAAKDYRDVLSGCTESKMKNRKELEAFFRSEYFGTLTALDGGVLIDRLQKDVEETKRKKKTISRHRKSSTPPPEAKSEGTKLLRYKNYTAGEYLQTA